MRCRSRQQRSSCEVSDLSSRGWIFSCKPPIFSTSKFSGWIHTHYTDRNKIWWGQNKHLWSNEQLWSWWPQNQRLMVWKLTSHLFQLQMFQIEFTPFNLTVGDKMTFGQDQTSICCEVSDLSIGGWCFGRWPLPAASSLASPSWGCTKVFVQPQLGPLTLHLGPIQLQ